MALDKNRIKELLGSGLSNDLVATTVGCDHSYISQLMADEQFHNEVVELRAASLTANTKRDRAIDNIEDKIVEKLSDSLDMIFKPRDLLSAFAIVNKAVRRGVPAREGLVVNQQVINLTIPQAVIKNFSLNSLGEVVAVEGQTMVTMPAKTLLKNLAGQRGDSNGRYEKVSGFLPAGSPDTDTEI